MNKEAAYIATLLAAGPKPPKGKDNAGHRRLRNWEQYAAHILFTFRGQSKAKSAFARIEHNRHEFEEFIEWLPRKAK